MVIKHRPKVTTDEEVIVAEEREYGLSVAAANADLLVSVHVFELSLLNRIFNRPRRGHMSTNSDGGVLTDQEKIEATALAASRQKSLELLYDYTKFHIGVYLTVAGAYLTAAFATVNNKPVLPLNLYFLGPAVLFTMIAGFSGGVIVSSLTQWHSGGSEDFLKSEIGPWDWSQFRFVASSWTYVEHTSFWLGLIAAAASFVPQKWWAVIGLNILAGGYR
jgi:hypothetical protein